MASSPAPPDPATSTSALSGRAPPVSNPHPLDPIDTRAPSLWPDKARPLEAGHGSHFEASRFDPRVEQKSRERWRLATQFDLCRPALGLRVLVFIQVSVAVAALPLALNGQDAATRAVVLAFAALAAGLLWLPAVCALRPLLARRSHRQRQAALAAMGAVAATVGWAMVAALDLVPSRWTNGLGSAICGAAMALLVWHWLGLRAAAAQPVEASARLAELQSRIRPHFL